jgi:hypothetical protein
MKMYKIGTSEEIMSACVHMSPCSFHQQDFSEILNVIFALYEA